LATADLLQRDLNLNVYLPEVVQRWHGKMQMGPLFPGYIFVSDSSETGKLAEVDMTPGCGRLVRMGSQNVRVTEPIRVAEHVVIQLQHKVLDLNDSGGLVAHSLHPGDSVQIMAGPMHGLSAVFLGPLTPSARVQVLLHFLGRDQEVTVALDDVEACASAPKRVRRTRGHGRHIHGI
jgi:transcription antitermination factor NusG